MALAIDGFGILKAIGKNAKVFSDLHADVNKQAKALVSKQIKKSSVENLRQIYDVIGGDEFRKIVDDLKGIAPLAKRLDKYHPELKSMTAQRHRELLNALASGLAKPHDKPAKKTQDKPIKKEKNKKKDVAEDFESMKPRER
jgi:hypothetical protein